MTAVWLQCFKEYFPVPTSWVMRKTATSFFSLNKVHSYKHFGSRADPGVLGRGGALIFYQYKTESLAVQNFEFCNFCGVFRKQLIVRGYGDFWRYLIGSISKLNIHFFAA